MTDETIFTEALGRPSPAERSAFLERACAGDPELRQRIEELLAAHAGAGDFLATPAAEQLGRDNPDAAATATFASNGPERSATDETLPEASQRSDPDLAFLSPSAKAGSIGHFRHYEIHEVIGKGGFGIVLKAFDEKLHRVVAIKVLSPHYAANGTARRRFTREARAAAAVAHEHVVTIHAVEDEDNPPFLVMQLVDGVSLQEKLDKRGSLGLKEILRIGLQTADGLAAAHKQGLVHRDIKPANILLENGVERVKITDFGLARAVDDASITQSGQVAGTPMYMSPEQAEGLPVDHRSDLFSLGTVLYAMCAGRPPFRASGTMAVLKRVIEDTPRSIREINPEIPQWLCDIVEKLHAKKAEERFQTAKEVAELLEQHLAHLQEPELAPKPSPANLPIATGSVRARRRSYTRRLLFGAFVFIGALILAGAVLSGGPVAKSSTLVTGAIVMIIGASFGLAGMVYALARESDRHTQARLPVSAQTRPRRRSVLASLGVLVLVWTVLGSLELAGVLRLFGNLSPTAAPDGTLVVETEEPGVTLLVDGRGVLNPSGKNEFRVPPGRHTIEARLNDRVIHKTAFTLAPDVRMVIHVPHSFAGSPLFEGRWTVVGEGTSGTQLPANLVSQWWEFKGPMRFHKFDATDDPAECEYRFDPSRNPPHIDLVSSGKLLQRGIYQFAENELTVCFSTLPEPRPKSFVTRQHTNLHLTHLRREESGFVPLFNGKDLDGWIAPRNGKGDWQVDNVSGELVGRGPQNFLFTRRDDFADFHLRADVSTNGAADGGIFFRSGLVLPHGKFPAGYVATIGHGQRDGLGTLLMTVPENGYAIKAARATLVSVPADTVFTIDVIARGKRLLVKINDKQVAEYTDEKATHKKGRIALQAYSPQTVVRFRKIEIKELPQPTDQERIQGTWTPIAGQVEGKPMTKEMLLEFSAIQFHANFFIYQESNVPVKDEFRLAPAKNPKEIDIIRSKKGTSQPGIYRFQGDTLELCLGNSLRQRPNDFATAVNSSLVYITLKRKEQPNSTEPGWVPLFNGKNLTGWKTHPDQPGNWKVEDPEQEGRLKASGPASHLFSERGDYENFHLRVEAIVTDPGVFGMYYRSGFGLAGKDGESRRPTGYVAGFSGDDRMQMKQFQELFKPNEWFTLEVIADGNHRIEKYNGKIISDVMDKEPKYRKGHIVIRQLNDDSTTLFRKIEIEELPAAK